MARCDSLLERRGDGRNQGFRPDRLAQNRRLGRINESLRYLARTPSDINDLWPRRYVHRRVADIDAMCLKHRQLNVGDKEIECDRAFQKSQRVVSVPRVDYRVSGTAENSHEETTKGVVVVDDQNRGLCVHGCKLQTCYRPRIARNGCEKVNT